MSALRDSSGRRLSVLDEVLRAQARYRAWRRLRRAGLAGALLLLTILVSLWAGPAPAPAPAQKTWPGSTLVQSVPLGGEPHAVNPPGPTASWRAPRGSLRDPTLSRRP